MKEIDKVGIIGIEDIGEKIGALLSKTGINVVCEEKGYSEKLTDADLIIEALPPDFALKKEALRKCDEQASPNTIIATTACGGTTEVAAATERRERVVGLNFTFNPFEEKCLVQIVKGLETSAETVETCRSLVEKAGATAVIVEDVPGLIVDRTIASVINEAATMYAIKVADIEDIDRITKLCLNWPMGPFEFADYIGIDEVLNTLETISEGEPRYVPCRLLKQMVISGRLGKKTGRGFYTYS